MVEYLIGGFERIFALCIQISLSVLVFYSVVLKDKLWLFPLAILFHAVANILPSIMQAGVLNNVLIAEGSVCLFSILILLFTKYMHKSMNRDRIWSVVPPGTTD
jgi:uncharacterized membrane protein YhfC